MERKEKRRRGEMEPQHSGVSKKQKKKQKKNKKKQKMFFFSLFFFSFIRIEIFSLHFVISLTFVINLSI